MAECKMQERKTRTGNMIVRGKHKAKLVVELTRSNTGDLDNGKALPTLI